MSEHLTTDSIYYDLAFQNSFGILHTLLNNVTMTPSPDINYTTYDESNTPNTVLALCLQHSHQKNAQDCFLSLVQKGANIDTQCSWQGEYGSWVNQTRVRPTYHLLELCAHMNVEPITQLMIKRLSPERIQQIVDSTNVLNIACASNNITLVEHILNHHKVDLNTSPKKRTIEGQIDYQNNHDFYLCSAKNITMLSLLIKHGANFMAKNAQGKTAFEIYNLSQPDKESFSFATETAMAQCLQNSSKSELVLDPALTQALFTSIIKREKDNTSVLLRSVGSKALKKIHNQEGQNLLFPAMQGRNFALVKRLMDIGVDLHAFDHKGVSPLTYFLTLPYDRWGHTNERDRKGERRALLRKEVFQHSNFSSQDPQGRSLAWILWLKPLDDHGMTKNRTDLGDVRSLEDIYKLLGQHHPKKSDGQPDFFVTTKDGTPMFIELFSQLTQNIRDTLPYKSLSAQPHWHPSQILESVLKDPRFTAEHSKEFLTILFKKDTNAFWDSISATHTLVSTLPIQPGRFQEKQVLNQTKFIDLFDNLWLRMQQNPQLMQNIPSLVSHLKTFTQLSSHVEKHYLESLTISTPTVVPRKAKTL